MINKTFKKYINESRSKLIVNILIVIILIIFLSLNKTISNNEYLKFILIIPFFLLISNTKTFISIQKIKKTLIANNIYNKQIEVTFWNKSYLMIIKNLIICKANHKIILINIDSIKGMKKNIKIEGIYCAGINEYITILTDKGSYKILNYSFNNTIIGEQIDVYDYINNKISNKEEGKKAKNE